MREVLPERWEVAQDSEKEYWSDFDSSSIIQESQGRNPERARLMIEKWKNLISINKNTKILQIGCGPEDVINYFKIGELHSVDPLADFYKERFKLNYKKSGLVKATGEKLPFPDKYFDVVILANVLDHVYSPEKVLQEARRVMKDSAVFHFEIFTYQKNFLRVAKTFGKIKEIVKNQPYNIHHPYTFTIKEIKSLLNNYFLILSEDIGSSVLEGFEDMEDLKKKKKHSKNLKIKIPAILGLYGIINYTAICKLKKPIKN
jgi:ubiquinone/menaquinone biosynthesis C-methylase UbiE